MPQEGYPNLVGPGDRSPEEARAASARGGVKSGESRRKRKTFRESLLTILSMPPDDPEVLQMLEKLGLDPTNQTVIDLAQIRKAQVGDTDAARFVRDTVGEKPREGLEIGNLADRPFETLDLSQLSDAQLRELAAAKQGSDD